MRVRAKGKWDDRGAVFVRFFSIVGSENYVDNYFKCQ